MDSFYPIVVITGISTIFAVATFFLGRLRKRWAKYMPAVLAAAVAIACIVKAYYFSQGFEALGYIILMIIALIVFTVTIVTALIIEILRAKKLRSIKDSGKSSGDSAG